MARVCMPESNIKGITVEGLRTGGQRHYQGQIVEVDNPKHVKALRSQGAFMASVGGQPRARGYRCPECGHGSWFAVCGRCGATCAPDEG